MEFFTSTRAIRLRSHLDKYLLAGDDQRSVRQSRNVNSQRSIWLVDYVDHKNNIVILKSCYGRYLSVCEGVFLLGMTGKKIAQVLPETCSAWQVAWVPISDGFQVKLKTQYGKFLRANGGPMPWRNTVTHDYPHACTTEKWILWCVEPVFDFSMFQSFSDSDYLSETSSFRSCYSDWELMSPGPSGRKGTMNYVLVSSDSSTLSSDKSDESFGSTPKKSEGRTIFYHIVDESGAVHEETAEPYYMTFKGNDVEELTRKLEEATDINGIIVCTRSPLNGELSPLKLQLPPYSTTMQVVVVPPSLKLARELSEEVSKGYEVEQAVAVF